jgi:hypothetical protein
MFPASQEGVPVDTLGSPTSAPYAVIVSLLPSEVGLQKTQPLDSIVALLRLRILVLVLSVERLHCIDRSCDGGKVPL